MVINDNVMKCEKFYLVDRGIAIVAMVGIILEKAVSLISYDCYDVRVLLSPGVSGI